MSAVLMEEPSVVGRVDVQGEAEEKTRSEPKRAVLLYVDPVKRECLRVASVLSEHFTVQVACTIEEAEARIFSEKPPAAVVSRNFFPPDKQAGIGLYWRMQCDEDTEDILFILRTCLQETATRARRMSIPVIDYYTGLEELVKVLKVHMRAKREGRKLTGPYC